MNWNTICVIYFLTAAIVHRSQRFEQLERLVERVRGSIGEQQRDGGFFFFFFRRSIGVKLERINLRKGVYNNLTTVLNHMKEIQMSVLFYFVLISTEDRIKRYELKSQLEGI